MPFLASLGGWAAKLIGEHIFSGESAGKLETLASVAGNRFIAGFTAAMYISNQEFRQGLNLCIEAVGDEVRQALAAGGGGLLSLLRGLL